MLGIPSNPADQRRTNRARLGAFLSRLPHQKSVGSVLAVGEASVPA